MKTCLLVFFCTCLLGLSAWAQRPALAKPYLKAPLLLDGQVLSEAWIFPRESSREFAVEAEPLLAGLKPYLKDGLWENLKKRTTAQGVLSLHDIDAAGISVYFDQNTLEVRLDVPLKYRNSKDLDLNFIEIGEQKYLRPGGHSGYINLRTQQSYQYGNSVSDEKLPLTGHVDFVENINGFVFESMADYNEFSPYPWKRQDTRFRYDDEERMIRYTLGDLTVGSRGFQLAPNIAGLSVVREFAIQPYKTLRSLSNTEIAIKRPSIVEVYVNGFLFSQIRLNPGIFNIRDFPLATGQNSVKVKIRDDLGQEEVFDFSVLYENTLLGKDVHEFSYALGMPWSESGGDRAYNSNAWLGSLYHRVGLSDEVTFGVNYQNYSSQSLTGLELSGISSIGYFSAEAAYGISSSQKEGYAERLRYRSLDRMFGKDVPVVVALEAENRDAQFLPVSALDFGVLNYLRRYDAQVNWRLSHSWLFGAGAGYLEMPVQEDQKVYRANFIVPLSTQARMELSYNKTVQNGTEDRGFISFYWNESQGKYSASAYYDSLQKSSNLSLSRNNIYKYDDYRVTASVSNTESTNSGSLWAEYLAQPFAARLEHYSTAQNGQEVHTTGVGLNTGFAWVGTHGAFTQPINDSFVLVHSDLIPQGQSLIINPTGEKGEAQLGPRHTTVVRDQTSYYKNTVNLDSTSLPVGYLLDKEYYGTQLTYRSGVLIDLHLRKQVMVKGRLVDSRGEPLPYFAGDILNTQGHLVDNNFFTNKDGGFLIEGLDPGVYKVVTDHPEFSSVTFEVRDIPTQLQDLGTVTLKTGGEK